MDLDVQGAESMRRLAADLRAVDDKKAILKALRKELREPVPRVRVAIRAAAVRDLPGKNGLGAWVAKTRVNASVRISGSAFAGLSLRGGRSSTTGKKSDIRRIDAGKVRAPSWGRRGKGAWHLQEVTPGFFTKTVTDDFAGAWQAAALAAVDRVVSDLGR